MTVFFTLMLFITLSMKNNVLEFSQTRVCSQIVFAVIMLNILCYTGRNHDVIIVYYNL